MDKEKEFNEKTDEEKKADFLDVLKLISAVGAKNIELSKEEEMKEASITMGKVLYTTYSGMIEAGFNPNQALDLTKCLVLGVNANPVLKR